MTAGKTTWCPLYLEPQAKNGENAKYSQNVFSASTITTDTQIQTMYRVGSRKANGARYDVKWVDDARVAANLAHSEFSPLTATPSIHPRDKNIGR
jgi:hypothetical protein